MKPSFVILFLFMHCSFVSAQQLPINKNGKIEFYAVHTVPTLQKEYLYQNAFEFLNNLEMCAIIEDSANFSITAECGVWVYKTTIIKSLDGLVSYDLKLDVKDEKYRYLADNFVYQPYKRNRYSRYEPVKDFLKHLEDKDYPGKQKQWEEYKKWTGKKMDQFIKVLNQRMKIKPPDETISQESW